MSQKLILVEYEIEDGVPIDASSENLKAAYAPPEFVTWLADKKITFEVMIKESVGETADIPVVTIDDIENNFLEEILLYIEAKLIHLIEAAHSHTATGILVPEEIDKDFSDIHTWLELRIIVKEKKDKYIDNLNIKIIVG